MTQPTFRDVEQLSAFLDGNLSKADSTRLEARLTTDPELASVYRDLREARSLLRRLPQRRAPRRFALSPKTAGVRPPLPRAYPVLQLASGLAGALFFITLLGNFIALPGAQSPSLSAAAPADTARAGANSAATMATEAPTEAPPGALSLAPTLPTPEGTPELGIEAAPTQPPLAGTSVAAKQPTSTPIAGWQVGLLGLAVVLGGSAFAIRWRTERDFREKSGRPKSG
jgi:hypothetical protein